jgi:hypothetical protein
MWVPEMVSRFGQVFLKLGEMGNIFIAECSLRAVWAMYADIQPSIQLPWKRIVYLEEKPAPAAILVCSFLGRTERRKVYLSFEHFFEKCILEIN